MRRSIVEYEFGRLNILLPSSNQSQLDRLRQGIFRAPTVEYRESNWGFFNLGEISVNGATYLHGFLGRFDPQAVEEVADTSTRRIVTEGVANEVAAKARFFVHADSDIVAFHPAPPPINRSMFLRRFCDIFQGAFGNFFVQAELTPIQEDGALLSVLPRFSSISRVEIKLHPSNPSNRQRWNKVDLHLKSVGATGYMEKYTAPTAGGERGIRAAGDEEIESKISMAEDGYGTATVRGVLDGGIKTVSTSDSPVSALAPNDEAPADEVAAKLDETVQEILERFR